MSVFSADTTMVHNYIKQNKRANWSVDTMQLAVDAVRRGEALKTVAKRYNVPRNNTLRRHAEKTAPEHVSKKLCRKTVLSPQQESELHDVILDSENSL